MFLIRDPIVEIVANKRHSQGPAALACCLIATWATLSSSTGVAQNEAAPSIDSITKQFSGFDIDQDGIVEIQSLQRLVQFSAAEPTDDQRVLIVLIESRLLQSFEGHERAELETRLTEYSQRLTQDGWSPQFIEADVYRGKVHQDGRTVLALRRVFQQVRQAYPRFSGAILIGSFPESMLVRRWVWKHDSRAVTFNGTTYNQGSGPRTKFLAMDPELISHRSDIVLSDLDGNWEQIYVQPRTTLDWIQWRPKLEDEAAWTDPDQVIESDEFNFRGRSFEDFFFIDDAQYEVVERTDSMLRIRCSYEMRRPEIAEADRTNPNPMAMPEISVSRINPLHVAVSQPAQNLDQQGRPKPVPRSGNSPNSMFQRDPALERRLLLEYLDRNLAHRRGLSPPGARRVAVVTANLQAPSKAYFDGVAKNLLPTVEFAKANVVDFVRFLKTPAIIKGISAHSNASVSLLDEGYQSSDLDAETGGGYWFWKPVADRYCPSYDAAPVRDRVHFSLLRTLWENKKLSDAGSAFYVNGGCEVMSPMGAARFPYSSPSYAAHTQIAESLLFYANGLALIGRAKVFYDMPRDFDQSFNVNQGVFGDILNNYFSAEAHDSRVGQDVAGRNRAYFWSIIGDWTLRLDYDTGLDRPSSSESK